MQHTQWLDRALSSAMCAGGLLWHLPAAVLGVQCKETVLYTYHMYARDVCHWPGGCQLLPLAVRLVTVCYSAVAVLVLWHILVCIGFQD